MKDISLYRVSRALITDVVFQWKQGFYLIYILISFMYLLILSQLPPFILDYALPLVVFSDPSVLGIFFIGGMVLLEKEQGVLQSLLVTPLTIKEYIISKTLSLTTVALMAGLLITHISQHRPIDYLVLTIGILLTSVFFTLIGFIISTQANTINSFFLHMVPWTLVLIVPCIPFILNPEWSFLLLLPSVSGLNLIFSAMTEATLYKTLFMIIELIIANALLFKITCHIFQKKMVYGG